MNRILWEIIVIMEINRLNIIRIKINRQVINKKNRRKRESDKKLHNCCLELKANNISQLESRLNIFTTDIDIKYTLDLQRTKNNHIDIVLSSIFHLY